MQLRKRQTETPSNLYVGVLVIHGKKYWCRLLFDYFFQGHYEKTGLKKTVLLIGLSVMLVKTLKKKHFYHSLRKVKGTSYKLSADSG